MASIKGDNQKQFSENPEDITIKAVGLGKNGYIKPFDLVIHKGEVVGFTGLLGSGRSGNSSSFVWGRKGRYRRTFW